MKKRLKDKSDFQIKLLSFFFVWLISVFARIHRLFSAVGKNAKKSRRRELQMRYPETIPRPGVATAFTRSTWGYPAPSQLPS
ncbi:MAG: hypothetical protein ACLTWR_08790 [Agathobaculum desmolans]|uniref:hypothetical protein n=1 Tax=Agathobaculum desmolans TaxID=39484 RepID=UPI003991D680